MENTDNLPKKPVLLLILDGMGVRKSDIGNAVITAKTPVMDSLWTQYPHCLLEASEKSVGLPPGYAGHSEVGHLNLGSGQIVYQVLTQIGEAIRTKKFMKNPVLVDSLRTVRKKKKNLHLLGILSPGGVHGHIDHLFRLMEICKDYRISPFIHVILDGRDSGLQDGYLYLNMLKSKINELGIGTISSISGRKFAMDRNNNWDRTAKAYYAMLGKGERTSTDAEDIIQNSYKNGENDQTFLPTTIVDDNGNPVGPVRDSDVVIFYNYREDRARQLTKAFITEESNGIERNGGPKNLDFITMTGYEEGLNAKVLFQPFKPENTISDVISRAGMTQFHTAETEKYAHVTYFFNGGQENNHKGEDFYLVPSPDVFDYAQTPDMSIKPVAEESVKRIMSGKYDFILINFANPDMLGHTGNFDATVKSLETMDKMVKLIIDAVIKMGGDFIVTSDHGNCDKMIDEVTGDPNTMHTLNPVPFIVGKDETMFKVLDNPDKIGTGQGAKVRGILADVGVTILNMLGLESTEDMTGINLIPLIEGPNGSNGQQDHCTE
jgi:2,3-bisphosphoglycerate-independent phosphoglycerate mutase